MVETGSSFRSPRNLRRFRAGSALILAAALAFAACPIQLGAQDTSRPAVHYEFHALSAPFPGVVQTLAYGINDLGVVVGEYDNAQGQHGFVLEGKTYTSFDVPFAGAQDTIAFSINNLGDISGGYTLDSIGYGFIREHGKFISLAFPAPGVTATFPRGINDFGEVAGTYNDATGLHGFFYARGHYESFDAPLAGACCTQPLGINNRGEIVGAYGGSDGVIHAFLRANGVFQTLELPFPSNQALAYSINNRGVIGGAGFLLDRGVTTLLSSLSPETASALACGINDRGQIVGIVLGPGSDESAYLLEPAWITLAAR